MIKLVAIGYIGMKSVYINMSQEDAIKRYDLENPNLTVEKEDLAVDEYEVKDSFSAYDIWE